MATKLKLLTLDKVDLSIKYNGRSSDYIFPSLINGCGYFCSYCAKSDSFIKTKSGLKKLIDLQIGDHIISYNFSDFQLEDDKVIQKVDRQVSEIYEIKTASKTLLLTGEHLVYTVGRGWVKAKDLNENDELLCDI